MNMNFKDKVVVVTGGTRGIGLQVSEAFAEHCATVVVCATRQDKCDEVAAELSQKYNVTVRGMQLNVASYEDVEAAIKTIVADYGRIDVMVNNAGITRDNLLLRMSQDDWNAVITTNLTSVFNTTKAVLRPMLKQKYGRIINMSSVVGVMGNPGQTNYAASKAGIIGFSKSTAKEVGVKGITCNVIAPGFIETDMTDALPKDYLDNIMGQIPLRRLGASRDVANAVLFLASDLSAYITGQVVHVDGGLLM